MITGASSANTISSASILGASGWPSNKRSDAVLAVGKILWQPEHRSIPRRCLGWQEIELELEDTAMPGCLRTVDLADATQAALDDDDSVPFR
jgi:hypothetical protein